MPYRFYSGTAPSSCVMSCHSYAVHRSVTTIISMDSDGQVYDTIEPPGRAKSSLSTVATAAAHCAAKRAVEHARGANSALDDRVSAPQLSMTCTLLAAGGRAVHHTVHAYRREYHSEDAEYGSKVRKNRDTEQEVLGNPKYNQQYSDDDECYGKPSTQVHLPLGTSSREDICLNIRQPTSKVFNWHRA
jgi:hypothetical protein